MDNKLSKEELLARLEEVSQLQEQLDKTAMCIEQFRRFVLPVLINSLFDSLKNYKQ